LHEHHDLAHRLLEAIPNMPDLVHYNNRGQ
jgi:hypothetical protein